MFGFRNFTGRAFIGKVVNVIFQFFLGVVEEIIFNITQASATNAAEIPENFNLKLLLQDEIVTSTSLVVSSKLLQTNFVGQPAFVGMVYVI